MVVGARGTGLFQEGSMPRLIEGKDFSKRDASLKEVRKCDGGRL